MENNTIQEDHSGLSHDQTDAVEVVQGDGGSSQPPRLKWKFAMPVIVLFAVTGAYLIYRSFAATSPTSQGLGIYSSAGCLAPQDAYATCITNSAEAKLARLYTFLLDRLPDQAGLDYFTHKYITKQSSLEQIAATILASNEYKSKNKPSITAAQAVTQSQSKSARSKYAASVDPFVKTYYANLTADKLQTSGAGRFGIVTGGEFAGVVKDNTTDFDVTLTGIQNSGARWTRATLRWDWVAKRDSSGTTYYDWTIADRLVQGVRSRGINLLVNINPTTAPNFVKGTTFNGAAYADGDQSNAASATPKSVSLGNSDDYAKFVKAAVERYKESGVKFWQVGNEPNRVDAWPTPNAESYLPYLKGAYTSVHEADPGAAVLTAGMGGNSNKDGNIYALDYVKQIYAAIYKTTNHKQTNGDGYFDIVSFHPYTYPNRSTEFADGWKEMLQVRTTMEFVGDSNKKIWATEFGAPTSVITEQAQADVLQYLYAAGGKLDWLGPMFWYQYRGYRVPTDAQYSKNTFGLVDENYTPKPAYTLFVKLVQAAEK